MVQEKRFSPGTGYPLSLRSGARSQGWGEDAPRTENVQAQKNGRDALNMNAESQ